MKALLGVAVAVLVVGWSTAAATSPSGLTGRVVKACPAGTTCRKQPLQLWLAFSRAGVALRVRSTVNGTYRVLLGPGTYTVRVVARVGLTFPRVHPAVVKVRAGHVDRLELVVSTEQP